MPTCPFCLKEVKDMEEHYKESPKCKLAMAFAMDLSISVAKLLATKVSEALLNIAKGLLEIPEDIRKELLKEMGEMWWKK